MAKLEPVAIQIIGLEDMRRLSAALEQYNQNSPQQAGPLKNELAWFKEANANNLKMIDELHAQLDKSRDRIHQLEQTHGQQVVSLQRECQRWQGDASQAIQMLQGKRTATLSTTEVNSPLLREVSAVMRALEANSVTIRNLQEDHLVKNVGAERLREKLAEANDTIAKQADVIKELHAQYHELEGRKQGVQFDLDRAKDEIEFAEAEIAKYKPLIEAVRGGFVYGFRGQWVRVNSATVADLNEGTAVSFFIPNSEDPQCL